MSLKTFLVAATGFTIGLTLLVVPVWGDGQGGGGGDEWPSTQ